MQIIEYDGTVPEFPPDECFIAPGVMLIGRVRLESGVSLWFGSVLRGDNEWIGIGPGSNLQEGCICHTDMGYPLNVGANCVIGHRAVLHGCSIGDDCLIGIGAVVLNGAQIGDGSIIAAGALVPPGKAYPPNSLISGVPGRIRRKVTPQEVEKTTATARRYVQRAMKYKRLLTG